LITRFYVLSRHYRADAPDRLTNSVVLRIIDHPRCADRLPMADAARIAARGTSQRFGAQYQDSVFYDNQRPESV
jgi:hypothetical protein